MYTIYRVYGRHRGKWVYVWSFTGCTAHERYVLSKYSQHPRYLVLVGL